MEFSKMFEEAPDEVKGYAQAKVNALRQRGMAVEKYRLGVNILGPTYFITLKIQDTLENVYADIRRAESEILAVDLVRHKKLWSVTLDVGDVRVD